MDNTLASKTIWTIGHSTHTLEKFLEILRSFQIKTIVDIRSYPGSRRYPQFNKEALKTSIPEVGMSYIHLKDLGGRRKTNPDSRNTAWRHPAFRGYADYMETTAFKEAIKELEAIALKSRTAYMCSESVWWRCHRSMVSDYLKTRGWEVMHIMAINKEQEHPYTAPARIKNGVLSYQSGEILGEKHKKTLTIKSEDKEDKVYH